jgi:hypothetical protein
MYKLYVYLKCDVRFFEQKNVKYEKYANGYTRPWTGKQVAWNNWAQMFLFTFEAVPSSNHIILVYFDNPPHTVSLFEFKNIIFLVFIVTLCTQKLKKTPNLFFWLEKTANNRFVWNADFVFRLS